MNASIASCRLPISEDCLFFINETLIQGDFDNFSCVLAFLLPSIVIELYHLETWSIFL